MSSGRLTPEESQRLKNFSEKIGVLHKALELGLIDYHEFMVTEQELIILISNLLERLK